MNFPPAETEPLLAVLREELQQCGVLLRLLETGRANRARGIYGQSAPQTSVEIEENFSLLSTLRAKRQEQIEMLTGEKTIGGSGQIIRLENLLPCFPMMVAPMVCGLVEEVNGMMGRLSRQKSSTQPFSGQAISGSTSTI